MNLRVILTISNRKVILFSCPFDSQSVEVDWEFLLRNKMTPEKSDNF